MTNRDKLAEYAPRAIRFWTVREPMASASTNWNLPLSVG